MKRTIRVWGVILASVTVAAGASCVAVLQVHAGHQRIEAQEPVWTPPAVLPSTSTSASPTPSNLPTPATEPLVPPSTMSGTAHVTTHVIHSLSVRQRVVFITIDDGNVRDPRVLNLIRSTHLPVSAFLIENAVNVDTGFWQSMRRAGVRIENHTVSHPRMTALGLTAQQSQICTPEPRYAGLFGNRPAFFRPPYGSYDQDTLIAADRCGIADVFLWDATYGGGVLSTWGGRPLQSGDIILMHFLNSTYDDLVHLMRMLRDDNLGVGLLEDYVRVSPSPSPTPTHSPSPSASPTPTPTPSPTHSPSPSPSTTPSETPSPSPSPSATSSRARESE